MDIILHKLDQIINSLKRIENNIKPKPLVVRGLPFDDEEIYKDAEPVCNCHKHKSGESTAGWYCPVHGQMF